MISTFVFSVMSLKTKSRIFPDLCVVNPSCWYRPMALMESLKIAESVSSVSLTCKEYIVLMCREIG